MFVYSGSIFQPAMLDYRSVAAIEHGGISIAKITKGYSIYRDHDMNLYCAIHLESSRYSFYSDSMRLAKTG